MAIMLQVYTDEKGLINWNFGDLPNAYFLLGVLDVIKDELVSQINDVSDEEIDP